MQAARTRHALVLLLSADANASKLMLLSQVLTICGRQKSEASVLVLIKRALRVRIIMHITIHNISLRIIELLLHLLLNLSLIRVLNILLELHLLVAIGPQALVVLDVLGALGRLRCGVRLRTLLLLLQLDHLFLRTLELLQESRECLHDLLADALEVILAHVECVRAVWTRIADL
jgi:hypothetical protein